VSVTVAPVAGSPVTFAALVSRSVLPAVTAFERLAEIALVAV
jgi:hypothetical protein